VRRSARHAQPGYGGAHTGHVQLSLFPEHVLRSKWAWNCGPDLFVKDNFVCGYVQSSHVVPNVWM
jgi:hypothetical protein